MSKFILLHNSTPSHLHNPKKCAGPWFRGVDIPKPFTTPCFVRCLIFKSSGQILTVTFYIITTPILELGNTLDVVTDWDFLRRSVLDCLCGGSALDLVGREGL